MGNVLTGSLLVAVILVTMGFGFVANPTREFDVLRIIQLSLTTLVARSDPRASYGTLWLFFLTWLVGALVTIAESERRGGSRKGSRWWLSALGTYAAITLTLMAIGLVLHASRLKPYTDVANTVASF